MRHVLFSVLILASCSKPPPEAPKQLADLSLYLFREFDSDQEEVAAGLVNLHDWMLKQDLDLDPSELAVTLPTLKGADLGPYSIPDGADAASQVPIGLPGLSQYSADDHLDVILDTNQVCIESATTKFARREFLTDEGCFASGDCDELSTLTNVYKENPLAKVWYDMYKDYRRIELEEIGTAYIGRAWIEEVFEGESGNTSWDQLFAIDVLIPGTKNGTTLRYFGMWSSITVPLIGDDSYAVLVRDGIDEAFRFGEEYLAGDIASCRNDRDAPRSDFE